VKPPQFYFKHGPSVDSNRLRRLIAQTHLPNGFKAGATRRIFMRRKITLFYRKRNDFFRRPGDSGRLAEPARLNIRKNSDIRFAVRPSAKDGRRTDCLSLLRGKT